MSNRTKFRVPLIIIIALIIIFSLLPSTGEESKLPFDKLEHFIAYFSLMFFIMLSFSSRVVRIAGFFLSIGLGILMEYAQQFIPGRQVSMYDEIANVSGLVVAVVVMLLFYTKIEKFISIVLKSSYGIVCSWNRKSK